MLTCVGVWLFKRWHAGRDFEPAPWAGGGLWTDVLSDYHDPGPARIADEFPAWSGSRLRDAGSDHRLRE